MKNQTFKHNEWVYYTEKSSHCQGSKDIITGKRIKSDEKVYKNPFMNTK